jgi:hypothetical protein
VIGPVPRSAHRPTRYGDRIGAGTDASLARSVGVTKEISPDGPSGQTEPSDAGFLSEAPRRQTVRRARSLLHAPVHCPQGERPHK